MAEDDSQVELTIDLDNEEDETQLQSILSSLPLEAVITKTLHEAGVTQHVMLALLITSDDTMRDLNKKYRGQDKSTDVLSFPLLDKPIVSAPINQLWMLPEVLDGEEVQSKQVFITPAGLSVHLGDIAISWPTVLRQATEAGSKPTYELLYLLSHGLLHLIGYDDQTEAGYQAMIRIQQIVMDFIEQKA
jgi:probable rRNA maturation factor